jgi:hypothetical protein
MSRLTDATLYFAIQGGGRGEGGAEISFTGSELVAQAGVRPNTSAFNKRVPYDAGSMRFLRFFGRGSELSFQYSRDGGFFTTFAQTTTPVKLTDIRVVIGLYVNENVSSNDDAGVELFVDNLNRIP